MIFQFEGGTLVGLTSEIKPHDIDEVSAITSLARPGPLENNLHKAYMNAKFHNETYTYDLKDDKLINVVRECCKAGGLLIYQEDIIRCFQRISDFNLIEADNARAILGEFLPVILVII